VLKKPSLLLIEGDSSVSKLFSDVFVDRGWHVDVCPNGTSAVLALNKLRHYEVILVSYVVPETTGINLVRLIRSIAHRRNSPIVMVTGSGNVDEEALAAGVDEVWHKPVDILPFIAAIEKYAICTIQRQSDIVA
jgi:CheY-like chemotaxis protein